MPITIMAVRKFPPDNTHVILEKEKLGIDHLY